MVTEVDNYKSATNESASKIVESQILDEIRNSRYLIVCNKPTKISALGAVPKSDSNKMRLIHDCSRPAFDAVNSHSSPENVSFTSVDEALKLLKPNSYMAKIDLASAYRHVPIHPSDYTAMGIKWKFRDSKKYTYMVDTRLPFGASKSVFIFNHITQSVVRMAQKRGISVVCYLDDFLVAGDSLKQCKESYDLMLSLLQNLGFTINWNKVVQPTQSLTFLGINIDSVSQTLSIPDMKLNEIRTALADALHCVKMTKRELQSLIGTLMWAARCVRAIRPIIRTFIDLTMKLKHPQHKVRLNKQVKNDLQFLSQWCLFFNGKAVMLDKTPLPSYMFGTDACTDGGAAHCGLDWFYVYWQTDFPFIFKEHINLKELFVVLLSAWKWASVWSGRQIIVYTDNQATMYAINKGSMKHKLGNLFVREILWLSAVYNFTITARYVRSKNNVVADAMSRLNDQVNAMIAWNLIFKNGLDLNLCNHITNVTFNFLYYRGCLPGIMFGC